MINLRVLIYFLVFISWYLFNQFYLMRWPNGSLIKGLSYGWTAGSLAGNMWCTKIAIELIQTSIALGDPEPWKTWIPYTALLGAAFFAIVNVIFLTKGLQHYEAFFMITTVEGSMILSASLSGAIVLLDVRDLEVWRICMYSLCVLLVISGMVTVFRGEASSKSSLMSGNASIADSDIKDKAEKAVAIPTIPPSPQGSTSSYTGRVHAGVPPSPTTSLISDKEGNGRLRAISSEDIENGVIVINDRPAHPPTIAENDVEDCIRTGSSSSSASCRLNFGGGDRPEPLRVKQGEVLELTAHISELRDTLHFTLRRGPVCGVVPLASRLSKLCEALAEHNQNVFTILECEQRVGHVYGRMSEASNRSSTMLQQAEAVAALEDPLGRDLLERMPAVGKQAFKRWCEVWEPQQNRGNCGPASAMAALRFLGLEGSWTQVIIPHGLFTQGLSFQNCSIMLQVLGHGRLRISERSSSDEAQISDQLRQDLAEAFEEGGMVCVLVNYTRLGGGHWSPVGGWSGGHVLILDTNDMRLPPHWVKVETLTKSMCSLNRATGNPRGYLLLRRGEADSA
eukprot:s1892_g1.t1